jgi:hypothetical protein
VTVRKIAAVAVALAVVGLAGAGCRSQVAEPAQPGVSTTESPAAPQAQTDASRELDDIQRTLDAIDSEVASDPTG